MVWAGLLVFVLLVLLASIVVTLVVRAASSRTWLGLTLLGMLLMALLLTVGYLRIEAERSTPHATVSPTGEVWTDHTGAAATVVAAAAGSVEDAAGADDPDDVDESAIKLEISAGKGAKSKRPAWVDRAPGQRGDAYQVSVASGPQEKLAECRAALDAQLRDAVAAYVDEYLGSEATGKHRASDIVTYDLSYIKKHLVKPGNIFEEKLQMSFGPMYQTHALLEFEPEFRRELEGRRGDLERFAQEVAVARRLRQLAVGFGAVFTLLAVGFAWLRRDLPPAAAVFQ